MVRKGNKRKKLILIAYVISIVFTIFSAVGLLVYEKNNTEKTYKENVEQVLHTASSIIDEKIRAYQSMFDVIAENSNLTNLSSLKRDFEILTENDDNILNIYFVDAATGSFTAALDLSFEGITDYRVGMEWYQQMIEDPEGVYLSEVYDDELTGRPTVTLYKGFVIDGKVYGAGCIDIDLSYLENDISVFKYGETGEVEVIDVAGLMAIHRDQSKIGGDEPTRYPAWSSIQENESGKVKFEYNSVNYEGYYVSSEEMFWKILIKNDVNEIMGSQKTERKIVLGIVFASIIAETAVFALAFKDKKKRI